MPKTPIGDLQARMGMDATAFISGLKAAQTQMTAFSASLATLRGVGLALGGALGALTAGVLATGAAMLKSSQEAASWGANIVEQAAVTGISIEQLDLMRRAFAGNGLAVKAADAAFATFNRRLGFAQQGIRTYARAFDELGLDPNSFASTEAAFFAFFDAISNIDSESRKAAVAFRLLGEQLDQHVVDVPARASCFSGVHRTTACVGSCVQS